MYPVVARTLLGPSAKRFTRFEIPTRTVTVYRSTAKNKYKKVALKKTTRISVDPFAVNHREQDPPSFAKSFGESIVTRTYGGPAAPLCFSVSDASHCVVMCVVIIISLKN